MAAVVLATRLFGRLAVWLWLWGPDPDVAYERGSYGAASAAGHIYRRVWRTGQVIGWSLVALVLAMVGWRVYFG